MRGSERGRVRGKEKRGRERERSSLTWKRDVATVSEVQRATQKERAKRNQRECSDRGKERERTNRGAMPSRQRDAERERDASVDAPKTG